MIILVGLMLIGFLYYVYWCIKAQRMDQMTASLPSPPVLPLLGNATLFIGDTQSKFSCFSS